MRHLRADGPLRGITIDADGNSFRKVAQGIFDRTDDGGVGVRLIALPHLVDQDMRNGFR